MDTNVLVNQELSRAEQARAYNLRERKKSDNNQYLGSLLSPLQIADNSTFLDIGCGSGYVNDYLAGCKPLERNLGFDFDSDAIQMAQESQRNPGRTLWFCASGEEIPLADASVDHILCRVVLPLVSANRLAAEIGRIIRPLGTVALSLHPWRFYLPWFSLQPRDWKRTVAGTVIFISSLWFNLTGQQIQLRWGRHRITQTFQTEYRIRRLLRKHGLNVYRVVREPEFIVYAKSFRSSLPEVARPPLAVMKIQAPQKGMNLV
jgi:SAM-dependent methyltransferase